MNAQKTASSGSRLVAVNGEGRVIGQDHHRAKLTDADVAQVLELRFTHLMSYAQIASKFDDIEGGITKWAIRDICTGKVRAQTVEAYLRLKR